MRQTENRERGITSASDKRSEQIRERRKYLESVEDERRERVKEVIREKGLQHLKHYRQLVMAVMERNVKAVEDFICPNMDAVLSADQINEYGFTIFHLIASAEGMHGVIKKLLRKALPESLERKDIFGYTALHRAAAKDNLRAVQLFVRKNKNLLTIRDINGYLPVDHAALLGRSDAAKYLLLDSDAKIDELTGKTGAILLLRLIRYDNFGLAFRFLKLYENDLACRRKNLEWYATIDALARKDLAPSSRSRHNYLQNLIYQFIPVKVDKHFSKTQGGDIENQVPTSRKANFFAYLQHVLWNALMLVVPGVKRIRNQKLMHKQTLEIVRVMVGNEMWTFTDALILLRKPLLTAAKLGNCEFVREILNVYPESRLFTDKRGHSIFHRAVLHRQEEVLNLINDDQIAHVKSVWSMADDTNCNVLHLAGRLVRSARVPGPALQMQREMQWFKTIKDNCEPFLQEENNLDGKKPRELFTEEHKKLAEEGEKWMKETATSCSVVAALIITLAFAPAFALPGGINDEGIPNFLSKTSFKLFIVSNALALFSATASEQMFLGILTSRYAQEDFLQSLKKLIIGLITLFFSIASMMVAFTSTLHLYLHQPWKSVTFLMALLGSVPITLFVFMEFPLLVDIIRYSYGFRVLKPKK